MKPARALALPFCAAVSMGVAACFSPPQHPERPTPTPVPEAQIGPAPNSAPVIVPRPEPHSRKGNPPFYEVLGKRYFVLSSSVGYLERGVASWYGPGFHKVRTSNGETYDMYGMSAAHKTLPLPAYVRVTNLQNGRNVVVRVNDRGPFVGNRIIDLSYTAASKLDMLRNGTAMVEVRNVELPPSLDAAAAAGQLTADTAAPVAVPNALFIQAGAFSDPKNAERLMEKLRGGGYGKIFVRDDEIAGRRMYRVRIGPVPSVPEYDRIVAALERAGINDPHLALD